MEHDGRNTMRNALAIVTAFTALAATASTASAVDRPMTLELSERGGGSVVIDRGQVGRSVGDSIAFSHELTSRERQLSRALGAVVGSTSGVCQILRVDQRRMCRW